MAACVEEHDGNRLGQVQSLVRAFGLLEAIGRHDDGLTLTEVAKRAKLPRSTAHRLLTTMNALRYVEFEATTSRWLIGRQAFAFGTAAAQARDLGRLGKPIMRSLMLEANQTVNIAVSDAGGVRYVEQVRPLGGVPGSTRPGSSSPMHTTASGKVMLANALPAEIDAFLTGATLERRTQSSIVERETLSRQLAVIRSRGYAIDDQENELGIRCVAAPVFDRHQRIRASLSISGGVARLPDDRLEMLGHTLAAAARRMSHDVGVLLAA